MNKIMNEIPVEVHARICNLLEQENLESVHMGYGSELHSNTRSFVCIARDRSDRTSSAYMVFKYDSEDDDIICYEDTLTYADALISMGEYIKKVST